MEKLAKIIANYIIKDSELDYEVVKYGVDAILSTTLCFSIALLACFFLGNIEFGIFYIVLLTPIKMQFLSYHCKTMHQCIMTYSFFIVLGLGIYNYLTHYNFHIPLIAYYFTMLILCLMVKQELNKDNLIIIAIYLIINTAIFFLTYRVFLISIISLLVEIVLVALLHKKNTKSCQND